MPITTHERNIAEKTLNIQGRDDDSDETWLEAMMTDHCLT